MTQMTQMKDKGTGDPRTFAIIGAAIEVHRVLGCGYLEAVYICVICVICGFFFLSVKESLGGDGGTVGGHFHTGERAGVALDAAE